MKIFLWRPAIRHTIGSGAPALPAEDGPYVARGGCQRERVGRGPFNNAQLAVTPPQFGSQLCPTTLFPQAGRGGTEDRGTPFHCTESDLTKNNNAGGFSEMHKRYQVPMYPGGQDLMSSFGLTLA